jgi:hypothetical protein
MSWNVRVVGNACRHNRLPVKRPGNPGMCTVVLPDHCGPSRFRRQFQRCAKKNPPTGFTASQPATPFPCRQT